MRRARRIIGVVIAGALAALSAGGPAMAAPDAAAPAKASESIIGDLAKVDLDAMAATASRYMGPNSMERLKNTFASIKNLGQSQYSELIYVRDWGQTEKDIIYKIDYDKAFVFVRFLWHVDNGAWRLIHLLYKSEDEAPLPKGWEHIYPK